MSKVERKEYQETKVYKTRGGGRGSSQNLVEFDNNLDHLLEDLQSSVTPSGKTGSSTYKETRVTRNMESPRTNSLNRVTHLKASNPVTEYSSDDSYNYTSPDGTKSVKSYKKESYSYSGTDGMAPEKLRMQNNINQLDSLLDDLKQVKHSDSNNIAGKDPNLLKEKVTMGRHVVERDVYYSPTHTLDRSDREGSVTREMQYLNEGTYGETRPVNFRTPSPALSQSSTLSKQKKVTNVHAYPMEVIETTTPDINPEILANLDPTLMPSGNTKVTTTIKTYTYEIPGAGYKPGGAVGAGGYSSDSEHLVYSPNQSQTTPSKSFVYNKYESSDTTNTTSYQLPSERTSFQMYKEEKSSTNKNVPLYQKPPSPVGGSESTVVKETTTTRNYQPGYKVYPDSPPPSRKQTYVYNESTTTKSVDEGYPSDGRQTPTGRLPPASETYIYKETHTSNKTANGYPPQQRQPPNNTTIIYNKSETNTTENYPHGGRPTDSPRSRRPPDDVNITYKYTSESTTSNNYKAGYPPQEESIPLMRPQPFPSDTDGPPKRVDELMAKIGNVPADGPLNSGFTAHEAELVHQKKVDTLRRDQEDLQRKERNAPPTKNISGPAVYYPPGHEMFAKKEEAGAWRAEGAMAKESGKYKYEAESGSKSKSKSGAAIVPVCLPLCCGIPCSIL